MKKIDKIIEYSNNIWSQAQRLKKIDVDIDLTDVEDLLRITFNLFAKKVLNEIEC